MIWRPPGRCTSGARTARSRLRYHGPVGDADRYLNHLLSPRFGRTLAVQTASGRVVGLGHLLWDGDETEVALLVEDAWQRRGIGGELLRRLVAMAVDAGCASVYAVTQASNTGMVAAMRGLGLPLDYQVEEGTLVITARLGWPVGPSTAGEFGECLGVVGAVVSRRVRVRLWLVAPTRRSRMSEQPRALSEGAVQVGPQVLYVLQAHRHPQQTVARPRRRVGRPRPRCGG